MWRKISILILVVIGIMAFLLIYEPARVTAKAFATENLGPTVSNALINAHANINDSWIWQRYDIYFVGSIFLVVGVVVKHLWTKADWALWRKFKQRKAKDMGYAPEIPPASVSTTPVGATTRPEPVPAPQPVAQPAPTATVTLPPKPATQDQPVVEEKKEDAK